MFKKFTHKFSILFKFIPDHFSYLSLFHHQYKQQCKILFSTAQETVTEMDHILCHEANINKCKRTEMTEMA